MRCDTLSDLLPFGNKSRKACLCKTMVTTAWLPKRRRVSKFRTVISLITNRNVLLTCRVLLLLIKFQPGGL